MQHDAADNDLELFDCAALRARLSPLQCYANMVKALSLREYGGPFAVGFLTCCLNCQTGRQVRGYFPPRGTPESPVTGRYP